MESLQIMHPTQIDNNIFFRKLTYIILISPVNVNNKDEIIGVLNIKTIKFHKLDFNILSRYFFDKYKKRKCIE